MRELQTINLCSYPASLLLRLIEDKAIRLAVQGHPIERQLVAVFEPRARLIRSRDTFCGH